MKGLIGISLVWLCAMVWTPVAAADDVDDVKAAVRAAYSALNSGNADGWARLQLVSESGSRIGNFPRTGALNREPAEGTTVEDIRNNIQASFDAGQKYDLAIHHLDARVYGDAAIATYYTTGPTTYPNGTTLQGTFRASMMWIKQGGRWKLGHRHISRLETEPPQ